MTDTIDATDDHIISLMLCLRLSEGQEIKARALKVSKAAMEIMKNTTDESLLIACRDIVYAASCRKYRSVIKSVKVAEGIYKSREVSE